MPGVLGEGLLTGLGQAGTDFAETKRGEINAKTAAETDMQKFIDRIKLTQSLDPTADLKKQKLELQVDKLKRKGGGRSRSSNSTAVAVPSLRDSLRR